MVTIDIESDVSDVVEEEEEVLAMFQQEIDAISQAIDRINEQIETIDSRYAVSVNLGLQKADRTSASADISRLINQIEHTSEAIRKRLRRIAKENNEFAEEHKEKTGMLRVRVNTHQNLTRRFMGTMQHFEESQEEHRGNIKSALARQIRDMNPEATDEEIADAVQKGNPEIIADNSQAFSQLPPHEQRRLQEGLEDLQSRNHEIKKLEDSIIQLHQMFVDMQLLVETQGNLLNNIEYNVADTKEKTEVGLQELVQARAHQKSATKKKVCIAALIVIILAVILVPVLIKVIPGASTAVESIPIIGNGIVSASPTPTPSPSPLQSSQLSNKDSRPPNTAKSNGSTVPVSGMKTALLDFAEKRDGTIGADPITTKRPLM